MSGGQTGVDRAALDVAMALQIPCGGWCPRGRRAEDGRIHQRYPLEETGSPIVLEPHDSKRGPFRRHAHPGVRQSHRRYPLDEECGSNSDASHAWLSTSRIRWRSATSKIGCGNMKIRVLNVAGPRASQAPNAYRLATTVLVKLLAAANPDRP